MVKKLNDEYFYSVVGKQHKESAIGMLLQWSKVVENRTNLFYNTVSHIQSSVDWVGQWRLGVFAPGRHAKTAERSVSSLNYLKAFQRPF